MENKLHSMINKGRPKVWSFQFEQKPSLRLTVSIGKAKIPAHETKM